MKGTGTGCQKTGPIEKGAALPGRELMRQRGEGLDSSRKGGGGKSEWC